jgi:mRNA interferase YafQ
MTSREKPEKPVSRTRKSDATKQFGKDWKRLAKSGRYPMQELRDVMTLLIANKALLPAEYKDHPLQGDWKDYRDCHVRGDWVLIYRIETEKDGTETIIFARTGTHADVFE